ncbi:MAG TPA: CpsD/CapB family tyrosine-protein kinase, partial [bacterium]|nr:CpsD/CapB family tyrosine-protein kinase [bacterium]
LTGFLSGEAPLHQVLVPTFVENLWFLPAGRVPSNPSELLGNPQLREMLMQQLPGVDTIIIDAPPVLPVTDAAIMAPFVNAVLLVCNVGTTPRSAAARARQQLEAVGGEVLGVVATGLPIGGVAAAYDSYYADYFGSAPFPAWQVPWVETDPSKMLAGPTVDARYTLPPGSVEGKIVDTGGAGTGGPDARGSRPGG